MNASFIGLLSSGTLLTPQTDVYQTGGGESEYYDYVNMV